MDKDIYDNQEIENEEYIQRNYQNISKSREEDENNNYNFINQGKMSGEESNKGEVFNNQNDNDINELDVSLNDNNNEDNLENINNEDERIDDINNDKDNNSNEEIEEPVNNLGNDVIIRDPSVSEISAEITVNNKGIMIKNKSETFGTLILQKEPVKINDNNIRLQIGRTVIDAKKMKYVEYEKIKNKYSRTLPKKY
jgi:hypothetical protein